MITWSRLEKGYRRRRNPTSSWNLTSSPQTAGWDSAAVATWLELKVGARALSQHARFGSWSWQTVECECVYVDKLHCTLNGVCDYTSSCVLHRSCPRPPSLPISPSLTTLPLGQSCGHTTWLLAALECSWQKQPEARHVEKIQSAHSIHSHPLLDPPTLTTPHFLPLSKRSTRVFPSSAHLWKEKGTAVRLSGCVCVWVCARVDIFPSHTLFLFVSPVALLMSCNIKLAVSESSQLSVSLVVPACRAAHLCLLDKTCSTLPRENTLSPSLFLPLFFFSFCLSHSLFSANTAFIF